MSRKLVPLFVVALAALGGADDGFLRLAPTDADLAATRRDWYGVYIQSKKVGWYHEDFGRAGMSADSAYVETATGVFTLESMGETVEVQVTEIQEFDSAAPYALRAARSVMTQAQGSEVVELRREKDAYTATITAGGETRTMAVPFFDYTLADSLTDELWVKAGRAPGDTARVRSFNVTELKPDVHTLTVAAVKEPVVEGVRTKFYDVTLKTALRGTEATAKFDTAGRLLGGNLGGLFELRAEPEEQARQIEKSGDVFVMGLARIDRPLGDPRRVTKLVLEAEGEGLDKIADAPRQRVTRDAEGGTVTLTLGAGTGAPDTATAAEIAEALEETVDFPTKSPRVAALVKQALGDARTAAEKVERLVHFVSSYVEDVSVARPISVYEIITTRKGDCTEHAQLFATLARAAGIPARQVSGLMYMGDDVKSFGGHAWNEVALDGHWVPVDPAWDETLVDAAHVTLKRNGAGIADAATFGRVRFRLKDVAPKEAAAAK